MNDVEQMNSAAQHWQIEEQRLVQKLAALHKVSMTLALAPTRDELFRLAVLLAARNWVLIAWASFSSIPPTRASFSAPMAPTPKGNCGPNTPSSSTWKTPTSKAFYRSTRAHCRCCGIQTTICTICTGR